MRCIRRTHPIRSQARDCGCVGTMHVLGESSGSRQSANVTVPVSDEVGQGEIADASEAKKTSSGQLWYISF